MGEPAAVAEAEVRGLARDLTASMMSYMVGLRVGGGLGGDFGVTVLKPDARSALGVRSKPGSARDETQNHSNTANTTFRYQITSYHDHI